MVNIARNYKSKQKLSRKHNSKKQRSYKKYGGRPKKNYSPEAVSQGDKDTEDYMEEILISSSKKGHEFLDHSKYKQYWLEKVIPSLITYIEDKNNQGQLTQEFYEKILIGIDELKYYIEEQSSYDFVIGSDQDRDFN
jgi:hypothetical protein